jgi:hypothetical protein
MIPTKVKRCSQVINAPDDLKIIIGVVHEKKEFCLNLMLEEVHGEDESFNLIHIQIPIKKKVYKMLKTAFETGDLEDVV